MTVMVPMIRTSLVPSVMVASAAFQEHKSAVEVVNANVTTLPNLINVCAALGFFPVVFMEMLCKVVHRPQNIDSDLFIRGKSPETSEDQRRKSFLSHLFTTTVV